MTPAGTEEESGQRELAQLKAIARSRARQASTRLGLAVIGSGLVGVSVMPLWGLGCLVLIVATQSLEAGLRLRFLLGTRSEPLKPYEMVLFAAASVAAALGYCSIPAVAWIMGGTSLKIFAAFWLTGSLLHVVVHMYHNRVVFLSGFISHSSVALALPIASWALGAGGWQLVDLVAPLFSATMFVIHAYFAYRVFDGASARLIKARTIAEEQRRAAEAASAAKSSFLATLSHEIRTPMNGILGMAAALEEADLPGEARRQTRIMREASDLLLNLLNDVLDMSKIEADRLTLEEKPFSMQAVIERVAALHRTEADRKGLAIVTRLEEGAGGSFLGDEHRLVQVLHNLTGNAVKFTAEGGVVISAEMDRGGQVLLRVEDSGIGMNEEEAAKVFEPFTQADSSTTRKFGGTGLGLTITKGIIDAMGGELSLQTAKGEGSCFSIRLPLTSASEPSGFEPAGTHGAADFLAGRRLLVIDDNEVNLAVIETLLASQKVSIVTATSGKEGVQHFGNGDFDLILLDISMPHLDGPATLARMRAMGKEVPPVLAVTAHAMPDDVDGFLTAGFDGFVAKPIKRDALLEAARGALSPHASAAMGAQA